MALRLAMRRTPRARVIVMMAGRPSGMDEAVNATTIMNMSSAECPRQSTLMKKVATAMMPMAAANHQLKAAIYRTRGVVISWTSSSMALIRPNSVRLAVATTIPVPSILKKSGAGIEEAAVIAEWRLGRNGSG